MLTIQGRSNKFCDSISRRGFLRIGGLGLGALTLSGIANTYTGATNVNAGTVVVSGSISGSTTVNVGNSGSGATLAVTSTGALGSSSALVHLLVGANGTLSGNGTINAAAITTNSGAIVAPTSDASSSAEMLRSDIA